MFSHEITVSKRITVSDVKYEIGLYHQSSKCNSIQKRLAWWLANCARKLKVCG